jgi:hypothetical protein
MLGGVVNYFVDPGPPKLPRSTLDNPDTLIPNTKFVYLFPEWLERKTRVWEDNFIFQVQAFLNGPTLLFTRLLKGGWPPSQLICANIEDMLFIVIPYITELHVLSVIIP